MKNWSGGLNDVTNWILGYEQDDKTFNITFSKKLWKSLKNDLTNQKNGAILRGRQDKTTN